MNTCSLGINWNAGTSYCGSSVAYNIYKSTDEAFVPSPSNLVASEIMGVDWTDFDVLHDQTYHYLVKSVDLNNSQQDSNSLKLFNKPKGEVINGVWSAGAETGDTGIGQATRHLGWELVTDQFFAGTRSYWSQNESNACNQLTSDPLNLTVGESSVLSFYTTYDIEERWDGGLVEVSVAGGPWLKPAILPDYPDTFRASTDQCGFDEGTGAFSGTNGALNQWEQHSMDLSAYDGQDVRIRFSYSTDGNVNDPGWYLDDIAVTNTQVPGFCKTGSDVIFIDGFE